MSEEEKMQKDDEDVGIETQLQKESKVDSPVADSKPDDMPSVCDVIQRHSSKDETGFRGPLPAHPRYLQSVLEYTSRIRAFIGLEDDDESIAQPDPEVKEKIDSGNEIDFAQTVDNAALPVENETTRSSKLIEELNNVPQLLSNNDGELKEPVTKDFINLDCFEGGKNRAPPIIGEYESNDIADHGICIANGVTGCDIPMLNATSPAEIYYHENPVENESNCSSAVLDSQEGKKDAAKSQYVDIDTGNNSNMSVESVPNDNGDIQILPLCEDSKYIINDPKIILQEEYSTDTPVGNDVVSEMPKTAAPKYNNIVPVLPTLPEPKANDVEAVTVLLNSNGIINCNVKDKLISNLNDDGRSPVFSAERIISAVSSDEMEVEDENTGKGEGLLNMADLRRLSSEMVIMVLDSAGNQIRDILTNQRNSNAGLAKYSHEEEDEISSELQSSSNDSIKVPHCSIRAVVGDDLQENGGNKYLETKHNSCDEEFTQQQNNTEVNNEIQLKDVLDKTYDFNDFQRKIEYEMNKFDPRYDVDPDTLCGIGSFKPKWIQPLATAKVYLALYSIVGVLSGSYYTYLIGTISTLEKRFAFKSKISGTIMMVDEITPLFLGVLVGYFGGKTHRPRMVAFGMFLSALCCFVSAAPYFIYGPAVHLHMMNTKNETKVEICDSEIRNESCDSDDRPPTLAAILFLMLGSFLKGFGNLAYYAVGLAYMDDNAKKRNTPMYFGIVYALRLMGPMVGFLMSSGFLKYYENPFDDPGFGPDDSRWIGGWWMGFVLQGVLLIIFSAPLALFPRRLPGMRVTPQAKDEAGNSVFFNFSGLLAALKRLCRNPLFAVINLNTVMTVFGTFGHYIMLPKYMENQFRLSASDASLFAGPPGLVAVMLATVIGGYCIWRFKPNAKYLTAGMVIVESVAAIGYLLLMIPRCKSIEMFNSGYGDEGLILDDTCNTNCNCTTAAYTPVCGPDGRTVYFSPCYAGCSQRLNQTFYNCSCIMDSSGQHRDFVTEGICVTDDCWEQALWYIAVLPIFQLVASILRVAHTMVVLRSIEPEDKGIALGTFETFLCAFGFIPFPVVFGALVDSACLVWEKSCGQTGNCWFYDNDNFNYLLHGAAAAFSFLSAAFLFVVFLLSDRIHDLYNDDEVDEPQLTQKEAKPISQLQGSVATDTKM